jgi:hypothetical protein
MRSKPSPLQTRQSKKIPPPPPPPNSDERIRGLARAFTVVLKRCMLDRIDGYLRVESDKARRAATKGQLDQWSTSWYLEHQHRVHGDMLAIVESAQETVRAVAGRNDLTLDCAAIAAELADLYIGRSRTALAAAGVGRLEETLAVWGEKRAKVETDSLFEVLWKHVEPAIAGTKS